MLFLWLFGGVYCVFGLCCLVVLSLVVICSVFDGLVL